MPKHSKSGGPPYTDPPSASYVVVVKPWSVEPSPGRRKSEDYNRIATWVTYVLWEAANRDGSIPTVECVYRMRTRDEVIVQLPLGTNTSPLLGQHNWASFVDEWNDPPGAQKATLVFEYNWTNNGDPANHNWEELFPDILPLNSVPIKSPYPLPLWVKVPVTLTSLVLSIPKPPTPPPQPEPQCPLVPLKTETKQIGLEMPDEKPADLSPAFRPYSPPSHYPLPARFQNKSMEPKTSEKPRLFRKSDPYEVEKEVEQLVCSFKGDPEEEDKKFDSYLGVENDPDSTVKLERGVTPGYQPSSELLAAFSSLSEGTMLPGGPTFSQIMQPHSKGLKRERTEESITSSTKRVKLEDS